MATTVFVNGSTLTDDGWFNDVDAITYDGTTSQMLVGGGAGVSAVWTTATGTGSPVRGTSPTITTSIVSGSTTMAIFNTVATTVNAFGAASTALNIGHASGTNTILGASTFSQALTAAAGITLSGTASNIATGSNYISNGGTDAGLSFDASNNATFSATAKVATTFGVGAASPSASGAGVTFPATQSASTDANTLDDYEEGTWTPTPTNLTVVGTPTYTGLYVKVGKVVYVTLQVTSTTSTASTAGSTYFAGLPFTPATVGTAGFANADATNNYGTNLLFTDGRFYCPTWGATATVYASGFYFI